MVHAEEINNQDDPPMLDSVTTASLPPAFPSPSLSGRPTVVPEGRKQVATRLFFTAALAVMALSASAWSPLSAAVMLVMGYSLVRLAIIGRAWTALYLIGNKKHCLVTDGPYSMCRNPLYFFTLIGLIGIGFAAGSFSIALLIGAWFVLYYPLVIRKEERKLQALHGEAFAAYKATTPAFFPRLSMLREAAAWSVQPAKVRRTTKDYVWMIWGLGLVQLFATLHYAGILPILIRLY